MQAEAIAEEAEAIAEEAEAIAEEPPANDVLMEDAAADAARFAPPEDERTWRMPTDNPRYRPYLANLMNFFDDPDPPYTKDTIFTRMQLLRLNPTVVKRWMSLKAYGKEEYDRKDDKPQGCRSSTVEMMKKAVSYFMPNKNVPWVNGAGNPTRHQFIHDVIGDVKKAEARQQGVKSSARRALRVVEFRKSLEMLKRKSDWDQQFKYVMMSLWQFTMIARTDDIVHFEVTHPRGHEKFPFALKTKVFWSKNINEERQCPDQILLGSMDDDICIFIALSIYLESYLAQFPDAILLFTEDLDLPAASERLKGRYRNSLRNIWKTAEWRAVIDELDRGIKIGTHSQRKLPATYASNKGCTKPEIEIRGRWQSEGGRSRVVDVYIDRKQEYIDAKVAAALCIGGPVKYELKDGVEIASEWLHDNVIPNIRAKFGQDQRLCRVLGLSLLYACMKDDILVPQDIKQRVRNAYAQLHLDIQQPVQKVPLFVHRHEDRLVIDEAIVIGDAIGDGSAGAGAGGVGVGGVGVGGVGGGGGVVAAAGAGQQAVHDMFQSIQISIQQLQQQLNNLAARGDANNADLRAYIRQRDRVLNNNIRAFGGTIEGGFRLQQANTGRQLLPLAAGANANVGPVAVANMATLSGNPRSLHELWQEYQHGLDGRKAARNFTRRERNANRRIKQKFYRRSHVWETIKRLVAQGHSVQVAIERIKQVYGQNVSVTRIINGIIRDKRQYGGPHPNLE